jgi:hypothetical protein
MSHIFSSTGSAARTGRGRLSQFGGIGGDLVDSRVARKYPVFGEDRGIGLAGKRVGLGRRRVAWTAMAQPMHSDARSGAASGRRLSSNVAEAGHAPVALRALTEGAVASSAAVREPLHLPTFSRKQRPGVSFGR